MKKETYAAPVMEIVLLERGGTVVTSWCGPTDCTGVCLGDGECFGDGESGGSDLCPGVGCSGDKLCIGTYTDDCSVNVCPTDGVCLTDCLAHGICEIICVAFDFDGCKGYLPPILP